MKRTIAIIIIALAFTMLSIWHAKVRAQDTIVHDGNVEVSGTNLEVSNSGNPYVRTVDTTNTVQTDLQSVDTIGRVGTASNHDFAIRTNNATEMTITAAGLVGVGTLSPEVGLHGVVTSGALLWEDSEADDANKAGLWGIEHYDVDEEPFYAIYISDGDGSNTLRLGGGHASGNSATTIRFNTGANSVTPTGSERAKIDGSGYFYFTDRLIDLGDTNTYISSTGTDQLVWTTGGTQQMYLNTSTLVMDNANISLDAGNYLATNDYIVYYEMSPPTGIANGVRTYARDNGGTTELCFVYPGNDTVCHADPVP